MINKQGLWFLTLFSLILVLSVYYITMPNELFLTNNNSTNETTEKVNSEIENSNYISVLKIELETERDTKMKELEQVINNVNSTTSDKNDAYEQIKNLNNLKGVEENLENKIKTSFKVNSFVKVTDKEVSVVIEKDKHDIKVANEIMRLVQNEFDNPMSISVKFTTKS